MKITRSALPSSRLLSARYFPAFPRIRFSGNRHSRVREKDSPLLRKYRSKETSTVKWIEVNCAFLKQLYFIFCFFVIFFYIFTFAFLGTHVRTVPTGRYTPVQIMATDTTYATDTTDPGGTPL